MGDRQSDCSPDTFRIFSPEQENAAQARVSTGVKCAGHAAAAAAAAAALLETDISERRPHSSGMLPAQAFIEGVFNAIPSGPLLSPGCFPEMVPPEQENAAQRVSTGVKCAGHVNAAAVALLETSGKSAPSVDEAMADLRAGAAADLCRRDGCVSKNSFSVIHAFRYWFS